MMTESEGSIDFQLAESLGSPITPVSGKSTLSVATLYFYLFFNRFASLLHAIYCKIDLVDSSSFRSFAAWVSCSLTRENCQFSFEQLCQHYI